MRSVHKMNASKWGHFCPHGNVITGNIIRMEAPHTWAINSRYTDDVAHTYDSYNEHTDCKSQTCSPYSNTTHGKDNRDRSNIWRESWTWSRNCFRIAETESWSRIPNVHFLYTYQAKQNTVFRDVTSWCLLRIYTRFGGAWINLYYTIPEGINTP